MQIPGLVLTSYQDALSRAMDVVANNVANVNTTGFKREVVDFDTYLSHPTPKETIAFGIDHGTYRDARQGPMTVTGSPLDLSVQGQGYFQVQTTAGVRYTRSGSFQINNQGEIVTAAGDKVLGDGGQAIIVPDDATDLQVSGDGVIAVKSGTGTDMLQVGKLKLVKFANDQALQATGDSQYTTTAEPVTDEKSSIVQGMLEQSNVQSVSEITNMISVLRNYQQVVHLLDLENQRQSSAITRLGKTTV